MPTFQTATSPDIIPFGNQFAAALRTGATDTFGPASNQVPGICNGTFTHTGSGSATVSATTLTGGGSGATFTYTFIADGTLSTIVAASGGSGYLVGDKLRITTSASHGSQVIEFRLVDGSNATEFTVQANHENQTPFPFAVHRARVGQATEKTLYVFDYRSSQVFPKPQDKLLDKFPNPAAAYGLRLGPAIRVRRESPGTPEMDIYFDAQGNLDTKTLLDFAGTSNVRCKIWYDQSGNGNDAEQSRNSAQPRIVASGVLHTVNGKPALDFDGSDDKFSLNHDDLYGQDRLDAYFHIESDDNKYLMFSSSTTGGEHGFVITDGDTSTSVSANYNRASTNVYVNGVDMNFVSGTTTRDDLHTAIITNGADHSTGAIVVHEDALTTNWTNFKVSAYGSFAFSGKLTEMVLYNTDQSANRENIEKDMALHSGAYEVEDAPLLDAYGGAHAAYSLRKLNSDYTGSAMRVRAARAGNPEQDIGFDSDGNLDTAALLTFAGSNFCHVKTWYDQSGNGNDVTQTATGKQPIIAFSEAVQTVDGRPAVRFEASTFDALPFDSTGLDIGNLSSFIVMKASGTTGLQFPLVVSAGDPTRFYPPVISNGNFTYTYGSSTAVGTSTANTNNNLHSMIAGATQGDAEAFLNGSSVGTKALASGVGSFTDGIGGVNGGNFFNGFIQEIVVYSSDQSERRLGIERNISNHYDL